MPVIKRSVSLDATVAQRIERAAAEDGVAFSAWLTRAVERQLTIRDGLAAVAEWEAEQGALTEQERETARHQLTDLPHDAARRAAGGAPRRD